MRAIAARSVVIPIALSLLATLVACGGGDAPVLDSIDDQIVAVGSELTLTLRATDPDGDAIHYSFHADVPGLSDEAVQELAAGAKANCPVSQALAGIEITLDAKLS